MPKGQISADSQKSVRRRGGWERVVDKEPHKMREIHNSNCSKYIIYHIISYVPGTLQVFYISCLITILGGRYYYLHFIDVETEDEKN